MYISLNVSLYLKHLLQIEIFEGCKEFYHKYHFDQFENALVLYLLHIFLINTK